MCQTDLDDSEVEVYQFSTFELLLFFLSRVPMLLRMVMLEWQPTISLQILASMTAKSKAARVPATRGKFLDCLNHAVWNLKHGAAMQV